MSPDSKQDLEELSLTFSVEGDKEIGIEEFRDLLLFHIALDDLFRVLGGGGLVVTDGREMETTSGHRDAHADDDTGSNGEKVPKPAAEMLISRSDVLKLLGEMAERRRKNPLELKKLFRKAYPSEIWEDLVPTVSVLRFLTNILLQDEAGF